MARIAGVNIPDDKRAGISLTYIFGIGRPLAKTIIQRARLDPGKRVRDLGPQELARIQSLLEKGYRIEGELRRIVSFNVKRLKDIGSYRGQRHAKGLPVRGQRTRTNARTRRGKKRTIGGMKRRLEKT